MSSPLSQVLILCSVISLFSTSVNSLILFDYNVIIVNVASSKVDVKCTLRGQGLGDHPMNPRDSYNIDVPIVVKGDNRVFCDFNVLTGTKRHGHFEIFDYDRDKNTCEGTSNCHWEIQGGGLCFIVGTNCNLFFKWQ